MSTLDGWIEAERNGVQFPVPFDAAWQIAGYSKKANAKQSGLKGLQKDKEFSCEISKNALAGRPSDSIMLSVDGMKHMCLMACTHEGRQIRDYFIEAEKKWKLTKQVAPAVTSVTAGIVYVRHNKRTEAETRDTRALEESNPDTIFQTVGTRLVRWTATADCNANSSKD